MGYYTNTQQAFRKNKKKSAYINLLLYIPRTCNGHYSRILSDIILLKNTKNIPYISYSGIMGCRDCERAY